ncbi:MAG: DUF6064 family protein [Verrucomicrobiota bacterium]
MLADLSSYSIRNFISFMDEVYFRLFERQFEAWWPTHLVMLALGIAILVLAFLGKNRVVALALAIPFAVSAITFHFQLYAELTPVGKIFGWGFLMQILLILIWGFVTKSRETFRPKVPIIIGALIAVFGLIYPVLALITERKWLGAEYYGMAPDPTVCFFFGIALMCARPIWFFLLLPIPLLWTIVTWGTLDTFDVPYALTLPIIAAITVAAGIWKGLDLTSRTNLTQRA